MAPLTERWRTPRGAFEQWLSIVVAVAFGGAGLYAVGGDLPLQRGLVFVGGPLLWLSGLAPRLHAYLHAPARLRLLPLPLPATAHWRAAASDHRRGIALTVGLGSLAIGGGAGPHLGPATTLGLVADWWWLSLAVVATEAWTPALAAWLGRRFPDDRFGHRLQTGLSGGWTLPEASVHLYVPPLMLGLATAIAIPGQLAIDRWVDGRPPPPGIEIAAVVAIAVVLALRPLARRVYGKGVFEAVPWLAQATRTLAGPPVPSPLPGFVRRLRAPGSRLLAIQLWRTTPVPGLRLWTLLGVATWVGLLAGPTLPRITVVAGLGLAWLVPAVRVLTRLAPQRHAALGPSATVATAGIAVVVVPLLVASALLTTGWVVHR